MSRDMRLLALDTATEACSVALVLGSEVRVREEEPGRRAAEVLLGMIDALLADGGVRLSSLDAIAFGRGPGGFTGVRLAASVTQGLAFAAGVPVVPVSDLAALAQRGLDEEPGICRALAVSDARMREVYWGCFERRAEPGGTGLATPVAGDAGAERVGAPGTVVLPAAWAGEPVLGVGRGLAAAAELAPDGAADLGPRLMLAQARSDWLPRAREIARLAAGPVARGEGLAPEEALPVYVRNEVARPRDSQSS